MGDSRWRWRGRVSELVVLEGGVGRVGGVQGAKMYILVFSSELSVDFISRP